MHRKSTSRLIAVFLSLFLLLGSIAGAISPGVQLREDQPNIYLKYITGFDDNTVRPDAALTRAQGAKMLSYILDTDDVTESAKAFSDVPESFWGYSAIAQLSAAGVIGGYADNTFRPNANLTRAEFATILARIINPQEGSATFSDISGHWAQKDISALAASGVIGGYSDNTFRPNRTLTRAEAVKLINRVAGIEIDPNEDRALYTDLPKSHWAYYEIMAAASTTALETTRARGNVKFEDIDYIDLDTGEITAKLNALLGEFPNATAKRQAEIFNEISALESDVALSVSMSTINAQRNVASERDRKNLNNSYECQNAITKAKEDRYALLSKVTDIATFSAGIGMNISEIPKPSQSSPDELVALYTEMQGYVNDFNTFLYENSISYNGKEYSLSQAEMSSDDALYTLALDYYVEHEQEYGTIFDNLVDVRTRIANYYGYSTYTDIGYMISGKFYYTPADMVAIHNDAKKYIAPLYYKISLARNGVQNGYQSFDTTAIYKDDEGAAFAKTQEYLRELSAQSREAFDYMTEYNMFDTQARENKATGAFTTYIDTYETPFVFMNQMGGANDVETLSHEFGHALHAFRIGSAGITCSSDIAEIASYGMEMLMTHNYDDFFGENAQDALLSNFYYKLQLILLTSFMDEFQYEIYANPEMTIEERNALYVSLYKEYFQGVSFSHPAYSEGICWTNPSHIFEMPYYSIDYALALTAAFQLWEIGENEGFDRQFETYMAILESPFLDYSIETVVDYAGMESPLKSGILQSIADKLDVLFRVNSGSLAMAS